MSKSLTIQTSLPLRQRQVNNDMLVDSDYDEKQNEVSIITPDDDSMDDSAQAPLADNLDAMRDRYMPLDAELEVEDETTYTWDIKDWRTLPKRSHSPAFECGGHPWKILFFPAGNNATESVSFYLEQGFGQDQKPAEDWYACVRFMLVLWNPNDPSIYVHHEANHRFTMEEGDWGFTRFAEKNKVFASHFENKDRPLVEDDGAKVTAYVRVLKDPTGVLWHNFINYDSKKETGMVGLRNQGATCYLNSLLQSLYFTNAFRKVIFPSCVLPHAIPPIPFLTRIAIFPFSHSRCHIPSLHSRCILSLIELYCLLLSILLLPHDDSEPTPVTPYD